MSENNRRGKRKASESRWSRYRAWTASLDRGARPRYRILLALAVIAVLILGVALYLRAWISLPKVPDPPEARCQHPRRQRFPGDGGHCEQR